MRILYLFNNSPSHLLDGIAAGHRPTNQVYGIIELRALGHEVSVRDSVPKGLLRAPINWLNRAFGFAIKDFATLLSFREYDVVVVKGSLSLSASVAGRVLRTKVVFLDALLRPPANPIRRLIDAMTIRIAASVIAYSRYQVQECAGIYSVSSRHFTWIPFCLDVRFFQPRTPSSRAQRPFALAIGADQSRDFRTLVHAMRGSSLQLTLVALPYLLTGVPRDDPSIKLLERVPYAQLLDLYSACSFVVVPLRKWAGSYPSGITSVLEAKLLARPAIVSETPILREYVTEDDGVVFVPPEDPIALRRAMDQLTSADTAIVESRSAEGAARVRVSYSMAAFAERFAQHLVAIVEVARRERSS